MEHAEDEKRNDIQVQMNKFEKMHRPQSSLIQEKYHVTRLRTFAKLNGYQENFEDFDTEDLDSLLRHFYNNLSKENGESYSCASLLCIRAAISRHLSNSPHNKPYNLIEDRQFLSSNNMLKAKMAESLKSGRAPKHFDMIQPGDQEKLKIYFDRSSPLKLQEEVWYTFVYHFGNRGRESIKELKKQDFRFGMDGDGEEYCELTKVLGQKNVTPDDNDNLKCGRVYSTKSNDCPVYCLKLYLSKMSETKDDTFWPKPKRAILNQNCWYEKRQVVGRTVLGEYMKRISTNACLSRIYTNHCVRPTMITNLKSNGFKNDEICLITGHKSERSINRYDRLANERTIKRLSNSLSIGKIETNTEINEQKIRRTKKDCYVNCTFQNCTFK